MRAMGRIFEVRKHTMFARWNRMAKQFARIAKDITMAVKSGGADPASNPTLRRTIQNARAVNMPRTRSKRPSSGRPGATRRTTTRVLYEGWGAARRGTAGGDGHRQPDAHGRRDAQHHHLGAGNLATNGSVGFLFRKMGVNSA
jgi:transcriptional/translational regulatory protein YebC/TACO1